MGNFVGKALAGVAFASLAAVAAPAQNLTVQFQLSGAPIQVDPYNEALAAGVPASAQPVLIDVRYRDLAAQFSGDPVDVDRYNGVLGELSLSFTRMAVLENPYAGFAMMPGDTGPRLWEGVSFEKK